MPVRDNTKIWNFYAPVYNLFMLTNKNAYEEMYRKIRKAIQNKKVLELGQKFQKPISRRISRKIC